MEATYLFHKDGHVCLNYDFFQKIYLSKRRFLRDKTFYNKIELLNIFNQKLTVEIEIFKIEKTNLNESIKILEITRNPDYVLDLLKEVGSIELLKKDRVLMIRAFISPLYFNNDKEINYLLFNKQIVIINFENCEKSIYFTNDIRKSNYTILSRQNFSKLSGSYFDLVDMENIFMS